MVEDNIYVIKGPEPLQPLLNISLGQLIYGTLTDGSNLNNIALVDAITSRSFTYKDLLQKSCLLAESLLNAGFGQNTVFSISSENNLEFFIPVISAFYLGSIVAPLNHNYTKEELKHSLNVTKPEIIFCSKAIAAKFVHMKVYLKHSFIKKIIVIDSDDDIFGTESLNYFIKNNQRRNISDDFFMKFNVNKDFDPEEQVAAVMCSSGTTGLPKGVMQTHKNLIYRYMQTLDPRYVKNFGKNSPFFGILPFFHGYGFVTNFFALCTGQKIVVLKRFEEMTFLRTIQDYQIPSLWIAPPLVVFLAKSPLVKEYDLSSVQEIVSGAAPLSKETEESVKSRLNIKTIRQGYGLTEATLAVIATVTDETKFGSSGRVMSYVICKVRDPETGKSLPPNTVGELCFKGPMVMKGYYGNEEATRNSFTSDGWLLSGDLAYYDEDGYFFVVDRLKELIKYKGYQVAPAELEGVLLSHPKIKDAGVVGVPAEDVGELPLAFVVKNKNVQLTEKEVEEFVAARVSSQKKLRGGVIFVTAIPKNPSGKILRRELRNMLKNHKLKL